MSIVNSDFEVLSNHRVAEETFALRFRSPELARLLRPGQFLNIRVNDSIDPLLRRPYSISTIDGDDCEILYTVMGKGTSILARKQPGDSIGVLGPLGNTFGYERPMGTAVLVAGGIGVAPFPLLTRELLKQEIPVITFLGVRNAARIVTAGLSNTHIATDDGSSGYHGSVIDCMEEYFASHDIDAPRLFACGPNPMLKATQDFATRRDLPCELSLESEMACGVGICQGCPIERVQGERTYALVCTEGPCFDANDILFHEHHHA
jgi:dihydroorotate dehydrogenase electron transfer subunit